MLKGSKVVINCFQYINSFMDYKSLFRCKTWLRTNLVASKQDDRICTCMVRLLATNFRTVKDPVKILYIKWVCFEMFFMHWNNSKNSKYLFIFFSKMSWSDILYPGNDDRRAAVVRKLQNLLDSIKDNFRATNRLVQYLNDNVTTSNLTKIYVDDSKTLRGNADVLVNQIKAIDAVLGKIDEELKKKLEPDLYAKLTNVDTSFEQKVNLWVIWAWNIYLFASLRILFSLLGKEDNVYCNKYWCSLMQKCSRWWYWWWWFDRISEYVFQDFILRHFIQKGSDMLQPLLVTFSTIDFQH